MGAWKKSTFSLEPTFLTSDPEKGAILFFGPIGPDWVIGWSSCAPWLYLPLNPTKFINILTLLTLTLKMKAAYSSKTLVFNQRTAWLKKPEDHKLKQMGYSFLL
jgi:hypothetical protein